MNKRGFIRTLEAVIAIIVVFVFIYAMSRGSFERDSSTKETIKSLQEEVLRGINEDEDYRNCVVKLGADNVDLRNPPSGGLVDDSIPPQSIAECTGIKTYVENSLGRFSPYNYALFICKTGSCGIPDYLPDKEVYTSAVIITSSLVPAKYEPKIVRLWVW